jgi:predicted aconitase
VRLTLEEQAIYDGKLGEGRQFAMKILTNIGELYGAGRLVDIQSAVVKCPSSKMGAEGWLGLLKYFSSRRLGVKVPTFTNPSLLKISKWNISGSAKSSGEDNKQYLRTQEQLKELYKRVRIKTKPIYPYPIPDKQSLSRPHMAIADPGTSVFLNSNFGIRTNTESSAVALAAGVLGKTTLSGLHLIENRIPEVVVKLDIESIDLDELDLTEIGLLIGELYKTRIPYIKFPDDNVLLTAMDLIDFSSALAFAGQVPMFHIANTTPEHFLYKPTAIKKRIKIGKRELKKLHERWRPSSVPDIVVVGNPFTGRGELTKIGELVKNKKFKGDPELWLFTQKELLKGDRWKTLKNKIEQAGVKIFLDSWFEDGPIELLNNCEIVTDSIRTLVSIKAAKTQKISVKLLPTKKCLELAGTGRLPK